ncbi:MAG TPA: FtsX-like permease family protein, partial [Acidobacteriota bacterium]|nr:FtsX-like permease family protein [Acidobacteriota bacterium]
MNRFVVTMARREIRSSWLRLLFFFVCIALGVGAIVALRSVIRNFGDVITGDARALLTADIQIDCTRPWNPETLAVINRIAVAPAVLARTESIEAATMIRPSDESREGALLVELKGVEAGYPFYGDFKLTGDKKLDFALLSGNGALVQPVVLERLHLKIGDRVKIGDTLFTIRGTIAQEPGGGGATGFRYGPRVLVERSALQSAGLSGFGSRARRKILLKVQQDQVDPLSKKLRSALKDSFVRVRSYKESQENLSQDFSRAENFLSLTGFVILLLGGIGISSVTRVFVDQKRKSIAVLKCLGATAQKILAAYMLQVLVLGLSGSLLGIALADITLKLLHQHFASSLPAGMSYAITNRAIVQGLGTGILVTILFSVIPLLRIRNIKPNVLLREEAEPATRRRDPVRWMVAALVSLGLLALSGWQAGSLRVGFFFLAGLSVTAAILYLIALLLVRQMKRIGRLRNFSVRYAVSSLYRPGNQTIVILLAVGLGCLFIVATQAIQQNLLREMDFSRETNMPNMYLIDVQEDQKAGIESMVRNATGKDYEFIPTLRARIYAINGKTIDLQSEEYKKDKRRLAFEYTLTYRDKLEKSENVIAGKFWDSSPSLVPEISIEESLKGMMGLDVGGTMTFDLLGRKISGRVTSIRHIDWHTARTGFYVIFRPGTLESAPHVFIAAIDAPVTEPQRSHFQRELVDRYPNVTAIDVVDIVRGLMKILNHITLAVSFIGGFVFLTGILILVGSIAMTKFQRIYETAVLKTLGAKRRIILMVLMIEYGILGAIAGLIGTLGAAAL